jgi:hypothetical protein
MKRLSADERAMEAKRMKALRKRIADLEAGIQRLKERGEPTIEATRLLRLLRRSVAKSN